MNNYKDDVVVTREFLELQRQDSKIFLDIEVSLRNQLYFCRERCEKLQEQHKKLSEGCNVAFANNERLRSMLGEVNEKFGRVIVERNNAWETIKGLTLENESLKNNPEAGKMNLEKGK